MRCLRCNHPNVAENRFCGQCGAALSAERSAALRVPAESERRTVTILFADVSGFTAMSESLDPEAVTAIVNECFTQLTNEIDKYGGIIDKYMGDAIMALFGAPIAHENDPERAIMAALGMQAALRQFSEKLERRAGVQFRMRIGINTGPVVAGYVGSHIKSSYTVLGDAVNLAARIQSVAPLDSVLVNEATYRLTKDLFEFVAQAPVLVKGKSEPVQLYEVRAVRSQREGVRGPRGVSSPFVGRAHELSVLQQAFERALRGRAQLVNIVGEVGLGKSRLLFEFERRLRRSGHLQADASGHVRYLKGRSLPYGQLNTYWVIGELLRRYLGVSDNAAEHELRYALEARAPHHLVPQLARFFSLHYPDERLDRLAAEQLQREMHDALLTLLRHEAFHQPLVLVCEDMHWIDPSSLALLVDLARQLRESPILFIALYRPEFGGLPAAELESYTLSLAPLSEPEAHQLIAGMLDDEFPAALKEQLTRQSGGNPFYLEEIIKSLVAAGLLVRGAHGWETPQQGTQLALPSTLQGVIMERIDALEETAKRVLQQGAVIGSIFQERVLQHITDIERELEKYLDRLEDQDFVVARATGGDPEFAFRQLLSHEVVYNSLLIARRRLFHRRIGHYLENLYAGHLDSHLDTLAFHFYRGGEWLKAIDYAQLAGRHAMTLFANQEALQYFSRVIEIADRLESGRSDLLEEERQLTFDALELTRQRRSALIDRGDVRALIGEYDAAIADFQTALSLSDDERTSANLYWRLGDVYDKKGQFNLALGVLQTGLKQISPQAAPVEIAKMYATLGWIYLRTGKYALAEEISQRGLSLLNAQDNPIEFALLHKTLGVLDRRRGNFDSAIRHLQLSLDLSQQVGNIRESARLHNNLAAVYANRGDQREALKHFQLCLETMQTIGDAAGVANAYNNLGNLHNEMGDSTSALKYHELSLNTRVKIGDAEGITVSHNNLGMTYLLVGDAARASSHLQQSLQIATEIGASDRLAEIYRQLAQAALLSGELARAAEYGRQSLAHAQSLGQKLEEGIATRVLAAVAAQQQQAAQADGRFQRALELLGKLGAEPELAATHEQYGGFLHAQSRANEACTQWQSARALYERLGAHQDETRLRELIARVNHC